MVDKIRLPPNQQLIRSTRWPVVGEKRPRHEDRPWELSLLGLVRHPCRWSLAELQCLPAVELAIDVHCVTRWSRLGMRFRGIPLQALMQLVAVDASARFVSFMARSERMHSTSLTMEHARHSDILLAWEAEGVPLSEEHGGPLRCVVSGKYFYKSVKWVESIEFLAEDRLGYWERETGYHNQADPWREERYLAPTLTKAEAARLLAARDFQGLDLRGIVGDRLVLDGLRASAAKLRDASFRSSQLQRADFTDANLSNAHLEGANLRDAIFHRADLEGANFAGAILCNCDFRGASLFGTSFASVHENGTLSDAAEFSPGTIFDRSSIAALTDEQQEFVHASMQACGGRIVTG